MRIQTPAAGFRVSHAAQKRVAGLVRAGVQAGSACWRVNNKNQNKSCVQFGNKHDYIAS